MEKMTKPKIRKMFFNKEINVREAYTFLENNFNPEDDIDIELKHVALLTKWLNKMGITIYGRDDYENGDVLDIIWGDTNDPLNPDDKDDFHITYQEYLDYEDYIVAILPLNEAYGYESVVIDKARHRKAFKYYGEAEKYALKLVNGDKSKVFIYPGKHFSYDKTKPVDNNFKLYPLSVLREVIIHNM